MSTSATWVRKLQAARATDPALEGVVMHAMMRVAPDAALIASVRSHDAPLTLALALDSPPQRPLSPGLRLRTAVARLQHRHYEDAIASTNALVREGAGMQFVAANVNDALRLVLLRDKLAGLGVREEDRSMGNWELLTIVLAGVCTFGALALLAFGAAA
jgi:hypothetical protein